MRPFRIACFILLITGVSHLIWHFYLRPHFRLARTSDVLPSNQVEEQVLRMMNEYQRNIAGADISFMDIQLGFSLLYALFFIWIGVLNLILLKASGPKHLLLATLSYLNGVMLLGGSLIAIIYFFWLPFASFFSAGVFYVWSGVQFSRSRKF